MRRTLVPLVLVLTGVLLLVGGVGVWLDNTVYDSDTFARRATSVFDSATVRHEAADRLTQELVESGNQQAITYRPALQTAIEAVVDTDTFRAIFRNAVRTTHASLLSGGSGSAGVNLSDSVSILSGTLQLPSSAGATSGVRPSSFSTSFADVTARLGELGVWGLDDTITLIALVSLGGALLSAAGALALASDRRRAVWWLGWTIAAVGLLVAGILNVGGWYLERSLDGEVGDALRAALGAMTGDLMSLALWTVVAGVVVAGASASAERAITPAAVATRARAWTAARRASPAGTAVLAVLTILAGLVLVNIAAEVPPLVVVLAGVYLTYAGSVEVVRLLRRSTTSAERAGSWRTPVLTVAAVVAVIALLGAGAYVTTSRSADRAEAAASTGCNGSEELCDLRLDQVIFPGTHNSMSSALYPGWLFGEQIGTIQDQLNSGIRALLFDTHYGIQSTVRVPGSDTPIVLTDRTRELTNTGFEPADPAVAERATALAAQVPPAAGQRSSIYLCHNYCVSGAVALATVLTGLEEFLSTHPDDVVIVIIQDATAAAETSAAFVDAGLEDHLATLQLGAPLPTLRDLIDAGTNLVVFAEAGGPDAPAWYQPAYTGWFQETPFTYRSADDFDCATNRGGTDGQLFLVNHWVTTRGPDPAGARAANADDVLLDRLERCARERGHVPNIVAVDYANGARLAERLADLNTELIELAAEGADADPPTTTAGSSTTAASAPPSTAATAATAAGDATGAVGAAVPPGPETTIIALTGGDPAAFCAAFPAAAAALGAYAEATFSEPVARAGTADLLYAPLLERVLEALVPTLPAELAEPLVPLEARAQRANEVLDTVGVDGLARSGLADAAQAALDTGDVADGATLEVVLQRTVTEQIDPAALTSAAADFWAGEGTVAAAGVDFGAIPSDVAVDAGYPCLAG